MLLLVPAGARAESPYEVDPAIDLPLTALGLLTAAAPRLFVSQLPGPACGLDCDPDDVNAFDRGVIGNRSEAAAMTSDVLWAVTMAAPLTSGLIEQLAGDPADGWAGFATDTLVLAESYALAMGIYGVLSFAVRRPRPYAYDKTRSPSTRTGTDAGLSFPSGHTAGAFVAATTWSLTFSRRHPHSGWRYVVWLGAGAAAATTGIMRASAGEHFWSDVIFGAALGATAGWLVPQLHLKEGGRTSTSGDGSWLVLRPTVAGGVLGLGLAGGL